MINIVVCVAFGIIVLCVHSVSWNGGYKMGHRDGYREGYRNGYKKGNENAKRYS